MYSGEQILNGHEDFDSRLGVVRMGSNIIEDHQVLLNSQDQPQPQQQKEIAIQPLKPSLHNTNRMSLNGNNGRTLWQQRLFS